MQIVFCLMIGLTIFYVSIFKKLVRKCKTLERQLDNLNRKTLIARTENILVKDIVDEYRKNKIRANAFTAMTEISNVFLNNKNDISTPAKMD